MNFAIGDISDIVLMADIQKLTCFTNPTTRILIMNKTELGKFTENLQEFEKFRSGIGPFIYKRVLDSKFFLFKKKILSRAELTRNIPYIQKLFERFQNMTHICKCLPNLNN